METTKQCKTCNKIKTTDNFTTARHQKDGLFNSCKECITAKDLAYKRTVKGFTSVQYNRHKARAKGHGYVLSYSKEDLLSWVESREDKAILFKEWKDSEYDIKYYPSITKIDESKQYSIDNLKMMGWRDKLDVDHVIAEYNAEVRRLKRIEDNKPIKIQRAKDRENRIAEILKEPTKTCSLCNIEKDKEEFHNSAHTTDKKTVECKECVYESQLKFIRTKEGTSYRIYKKQVQKSGLRGHIPPSYTLEEFRAWLFSQEIFHVIFEAWERGGHQHLECVSCDREDRFKPYTFDNMSVTTWRENRRRWFEERK